MAASRIDILIEQGGNFSVTVNLKTGSGAAWDLTGYSATGKVRAQVTDLNPLLTFTSTINSPATNGSMTISATATQTSLLPTTFQLGFWELDVASSGGTVYPIYKGLARMTPWIAR